MPLTFIYLFFSLFYQIRFTDLLHRNTKRQAGKKQIKNNESSCFKYSIALNVPGLFPYLLSVESNSSKSIKATTNSLFGIVPFLFQGKSTKQGEILPTQPLG